MKLRTKTVIWNIRKQKTPSQNSSSVSSLWDNIKHTNTCIMGVPAGEETKQETENLFETIITNFPNLVKEIDIQVQEAQGVPNKMNPKRSTPRNIIIKMVKVKGKERLLKAAREKQLFMY